MTTEIKTICYIALPNVLYLPFNGNVVRGLEQNGARVLVLAPQKMGIVKYIEAFRLAWRCRKEADAYMVGYLSLRLVPAVWLARLFSGKPLYCNAGHSIFEAEVLDRARHGVWSVGGTWCWILDFIAFHTTKVIFLESAAQCEFIAKTFWVGRSKLVPLYYGADERVFYRTPHDPPHDPAHFAVLYRGAMLPFVGAPFAMHAMQLLQKEADIRCIVRTSGEVAVAMRQFVKVQHLSNVIFTDHHFTEEELRLLAVSADAMLGIFSTHPRGGRTIPNRIYEALVLGTPLITADLPATCELLEDNVHCLFVRPDDSADIVAKLLALKRDPALRERLARNARQLYEEQLTPKILGAKILAAL